MSRSLRPLPALVAFLALALCPAVRGAAPSATDPILETALHAARSLSDPYARCRSILVVARGLADAGLPDRALEAVDEAQRAAKETPLARQALLETAEACARAHLYQRAAEIADSMAYLPDAVHVLCLSAREHLSAGDRDGALEALSAARAKVEQMTDPEDAARALVRIAEVYGAAEMTQEFESALRAAAGTARRATSDLSRAVLLEVVADAFCAAGRLDDALAIARTVEAPESRAPLLTKLGTACAEAGRAAQAADAFADTVRAAATMPDAYHRAFLLLDTAEAAAEAGAADAASAARARAAGALPEITEELRAAAVRDRLAPLLAADGQDDEALALLRRTKDPRRRSEQMLRLAVADSDAGRYGQAVRAAEEVEADVIRIAGPERLQALGLAYARAWGPDPQGDRIDALQPPQLRDAVLSRYAQDLAGSSDFSGALGRAQAIGSDATRDEALNAVGSAVLAAADSAESLQPAQRALGLTTGRPDRLKLRAAIAARMVALGMQTPAREALAAIAAESAKVPAPATRAELLGDVALSFSKLGERKAARDAAVGAIVSALHVACAACRDEVIEDLFKQMSGPDYVDIAFAAADEIQSAGVRAENFLRMLEVSSGLSADQTERLLRSALEAALQAESPTTRVNQLVLIAGRYRTAGLEVTAAERDALRHAQNEPEPAGSSHPAPITSAAPRAIHLVYFDRPGCPECTRVKATFDDLRRLYPQVSIDVFDLATAESAALLNMAICEGLGVAREQRLVAPSVFSARAGLVGSDITLAALSELAHDAQGLPSPVDAFGPKREEARALLQQTYGDLGVVLVVSAAFMDGINPCAFTVIIFFLSYLAYMGRDRRQIATVGIVFTVAVFLTYLSIGLVLMGVVRAAEAWSIVVTRGIYAVTAALAVLAAGLSLRDGVECLRGHVTGLALALPEGLRSRIRLTISRRARMGLTLAATVLLGAVVALFEFPCTGWVYLPIIIALRHMPQAAWGAVGWLLLYNVVFILPLVAVFVAVLFGLTSERLTALFRRHVALTKFGLAVVFAGLGAYLIALLVR